MRFFRWHNKAGVERGLNAFMAYILVIFQCFPGLVASASADDAMPSEKETVAVADSVDVDVEAEEVVGTTEFPPGAFILGARFSDDDFAGSAEAMVPIFFNPNIGVFFLDARTSANDRNEEESNLGLAWRKLVNEKAILGMNAFWDSRWTSSGNRFDQLGLGAEILTERFDARFNYYLPEDDQKLANSYTEESSSTSSSTRTSSDVDFGNPYATGNRIIQPVTTTTKKTTITQVTTTKFLFEQYEAALEGWDAEIGMLIPGTQKLGEVRVFAGYQDFENPFGTRLEGAKGRLEVRVTPRIILDAEIFEEELLNGTDFFVGGRFYSPMDLVALSKGKNPFADQSVATGLAGRIADPIIRDLKIQAALSEVTEVEEKRTSSTSSSSSSTTSTEESSIELASDLIVVDSDNTSGVEDGSFENPYNTFEEGERDVENGLGSVYVFGRGVDYSTRGGGLKLPDGASAYGSGAAVMGFGGRSFEAREHPVVMGPGDAPVFTLGEGSTVSGFEIMNIGGGSKVKNGPNGTSYDVGQAGIFSKNKSGITIKGNIFNGVSYGAVVLDKLSSPSDSFTALIEGNSVGKKGVDMTGVVIDTKGASGSAIIDVVANDLSDTGGDGLDVLANNYDTIVFTSRDNSFNDNKDHGALIDLIADVSVIASLTGDTAKNNKKEEGVHLFTSGKGSATVMATDVTANKNGSDEEGFVIDSEHDGDITIIAKMITANDNAEDGFQIEAYSKDGDVDVMLSDVTANRNKDDGVDVELESKNGKATLSVMESTASNNKDGGFDLELDTKDKAATATLSGLTANNNRGESGVQIEADTKGGNISITGSDLKTSDNSENGIFFNADAKDGKVTLALSDSRASSNGDDGVDLDGDSKGGKVAVTVTGVTANSNKDDGFDVNVDSKEKKATVDITASTANDNKSDGMELDADSTDNDAEVTVSDVTANNNKSEGLDIDADTKDGNALVDVSSATANDNNGDGVEADASSKTGKATVKADDIKANRNGSYGLQLDADSNDGKAVVKASNIVANENKKDGIDVEVDSKTANAVAEVTDATTNDNKEDGIDVDANSKEGDVEVTVERVTANDNKDNGLELAAIAKSGDATVKVDEAVAGGNGVHGVDMDVLAKGRGGADAKGVVKNSRFNDNGEDGLNIDVKSTSTIGGSAEVKVEEVVANDNKDNGAAIVANKTGRSRGTVDVSVDAGTFNGNGATGLMVDAKGTEVSQTKVELNEVVANKNDLGLDISAKTTGRIRSGDATIKGTDLTANNNKSAGMVFDAKVNSSAGRAGDAKVKLSDVTANNTAKGHGVEATANVDSPRGGSGEALVEISEGTMNGNKETGLLATAKTSNSGKAKVDLDTVAANNNKVGMDLTAKTTGRTSAGDAVIAGSGLTANGNSQGGLLMLAKVDARTSRTGDAKITLDAVTAKNNGKGVGIDAKADTNTRNGNSAIKIEEGSFNNNKEGAILKSNSSGGDSEIELTDVTVSNNDKDGLVAKAQGQTPVSGKSVIKVDGGTFNGNGGVGADLKADSIGSG